MTTGWREYFDAVGRQSPLHAVQATLYVQSLATTVGLGQHQRVLDFGCGFGLVTATLAPLVGHVCWWEPSSNMRAAAEQNTAALPNVRFCDLAAFPCRDAPPLLRPEQRFDLILVNSVAQYMPSDELFAWLRHWKEMLAAGGRVVLSDLIAPTHSGVADVADLLRLGVREGSPLRATRQAIGGVTHYWRVRRAVPLTRLTRGDLASHAEMAGLDAEWLPDNLTHFRSRWAAVLHARPRRSCHSGDPSALQSGHAE